MNCYEEGGKSSNYATPPDLLPSDASEELHIVAVSSAAPNPGFHETRQGLVRVTVKARPKPVALYLVAYESMLWRLDLDPGSQLSRVIVEGSYEQEVEGAPAGTSIVYREGYASCSFATAWEGGEAALMVGGIRDFTGLTETSFQGCYTGDRFEIPYWTGEPPVATPTPVPGDEGIPREQIRFSGCEDAMADDHYCLTISSDMEITLVGVESGELCEVFRSSTPFGYEPYSIAWLGEILYVCGNDGLTRVSLIDGSWEALNYPCGAVAEHRGKLMVKTKYSGEALKPLYTYASYDAILDARVDAAYDFPLYLDRITVNGDTLYSAYSATDSIDVADLASEEPLGVLTLEGFDTYINGMAVIDDGLVLIGPGDEGTFGNTVAVFDLQSGRRLRAVQVADEIRGLSCVTRSAALQ